MSIVAGAQKLEREIEPQLYNPLATATRAPHTRVVETSRPYAYLAISRLAPRGSAGEQGTERNTLNWFNRTSTTRTPLHDT